MKLIGENIGSDISSLEKYEVYYGEGDEGELRLYVSTPMQDLERLESEILAQGVVLTEPIVQDARIISIKFRKEIAPLLIIAIIVGAIIVGLLGWQVFKLTMMGIPLWVILIGGGALAYLLLREPVKKATPYIAQAGKVYITRKVAK